MNPTPIGKLRLTRAVLNVLTQHNYLFVEQLEDTADALLLDLPRFGDFSLRCVRRAIEQYREFTPRKPMYEPEPEPEPEQPIAKIGGSPIGLRDFFAAQTLKELVAEAIADAKAKSQNGERTGLDDVKWNDGQSTYADVIAEEAYIVADAMIRAREVRK